MTLDFAALKGVLYSPVLSDVLDEFGRTEQAMKPFVRPLDENLVMFGRARTGLYMNTYAVAEGENPYEVEIALVDDLQPGDVAVFGCDGPTDRIAPWGELLSTAARCRGAEGCVTDGLVRDVRHIRRMGFPVFHGGIGPLDSRGRAKMMARDVPVACGGVLVRPGDLVFGDVDGVVVIPQDIALAVIEAALAKIGSENKTRQHLEEGMLLAEVYARYGVL
ncbi:RraA family protein [Labrys wisconsinensis]|uniref:Putative 4-hydroxy-4-methyl-2-oxoglutarate aldolase n=1 Tax=Labrys wisconsinensis TaxID=425677 RepID=A0ABU0JIZ2_9HYPH|nr:RraA family protein [Labrys wisconsinensis]MDQ0474251.1 regulator of RNase E activity RraA [Labrys wisconsinensis]